MSTAERPHRLTTAGSDPDLDARLSDELDAFNTAASGVGDQREFTVKVNDDSGDLLGGLSGSTWGPSAIIAMVWVRQDQRGTGVGGRLLAAADEVARERECTRVFVSSFTFQAPGFYERHGFTECARIPEYPLDGTADVYFVKHLPPRN